VHVASGHADRFGLRRAVLHAAINELLAALRG
jgi:hypothetical protein